MRARFAPGLLATIALVVAGCSPRPVFRAELRGVDGSLDQPVVAAPVPSQPVPRTRIEEIATSWLGTPYRYGGVDARGIDCSALVRNVFADLGMNLPRTTAAQQGIGRTVAPGEIRAGDLLFFRLGSGRVNHVGLALGPDRFIHASSSRGVVVDRRQDAYFARRFAQARRVLPEPANEEEGS
ncbi:MAG: NlpC/P60 family protein [bacterium]